MSRKNSWFRVVFFIWFVLRESCIVGKIKSVQAYKFMILYQNCQMAILKLSQMQPTRVTKKESKDFEFEFDSTCHSSSLGKLGSFCH